MLTARYQNKEFGTRIMVLIKLSLDYTHAGLNNDKKKNVLICNLFTCLAGRESQSLLCS